MPPKTPFVVMGALALGGGAVLISQRWETARLREEIEIARTENRELARRHLESPSRSTREDSSTEPDRVEAGHTAAIVRPNENEPPTPQPRIFPAEPPQTGDQEKGLTRLEDFRNLGRGTPSDAFQTIIWAAMKNEEATLAGALAVTGAVREKAEALLARLPESARRKYPSPESLAALAVVGEMLKTDAVEITGHSMVDPLRAIVSVRTSAGTKEGKLTMRFGPGGWQLLVPEGAIVAIERRIGSAAAEPAAKK